VAGVRLPAILARDAGGRASFETGAATLREALRALPVADLLFDARGALEARLAPAAEVRVVAAIAGGAPPTPSPARTDPPPMRSSGGRVRMAQ
jgi:hypothetical protein